MVDDDLWLPLVDEPIGRIVGRLLDEDGDLAALVAAPKRRLAFRAFASVRIGVLLGELLMERDVEPSEAETWVDQLLADPEVAARLAREVREIAQTIAADPALAESEPTGPDEATRARFRKFVREAGPDP